AMFSSFLLSRTFVPMMCAKFLPDEHRPGDHGTPGPSTHVSSGIAYRIDQFLHRLTRGYERFLATALQRRTLLLCLVGALFVGSLSLTFGIGREFFPQVDAGQITIYVRTPSKFRLDTTEAAIADVEKFLEEQIPASERQMIVSEIGLDPDWS